MKHQIQLPEAVIYTDGSSGNDGRGGWAAIVATPSYGIQLTGCTTGTTNNRMELVAAVEGLKILHAPHQVQLVSDSAYMLNSIKHQWYYRWFQEAGHHPRPNLDLWLALERLLCYHTVTPVKVKGHSGVDFNERVDKLAVFARKQQTKGVEVLYGNRDTADH
jgi:ribonuclease HI